jgi:plasmid maintenance system antidote protein VapI
MISRIAFDDQFRHAVLVRGLTLTDLAQLTGLSLATVSRAVAGRPVNMSTALRLARSVTARPVVPELESWLRNEASAREC